MKKNLNSVVYIGAITCNMLILLALLYRVTHPSFTLTFFLFFFSSVFSDLRDVARRGASWRDSYEGIWHVEKSILDHGMCKKRADHRTGPFAATSGKQLRVFRGDEMRVTTTLVAKRTHSRVYILYTRTRTVFIVTSKDRRVVTSYFRIVRAIWKRVAYERAKHTASLSLSIYLFISLRLPFLSLSLTLICWRSESLRHQ